MSPLYVCCMCNPIFFSALYLCKGVSPMIEAVRNSCFARRTLQKTTTFPRCSGFYRDMLYLPESSSNIDLLMLASLLFCWNHMTLISNNVESGWLGADLLQVGWADRLSIRVVGCIRRHLDQAVGQRLGS